MKFLQDISSDSVRALTPADAEAYRSVRLCALHEPPAFGSLPEDEPNLSETAARLAKSDDRCFFGAFQNEQLVGIVRLSRYSAPNEKHRAYLAGLYVLPSFRCHGYGRALVREALSWAANAPGIRRVNLTVVTQQEAAIRLYQSFGFRTYGTELETFSSGGQFYDEYLMTLALNDNDCTLHNRRKLNQEVASTMAQSPGGKEFLILFGSMLLGLSVSSAALAQIAADQTLPVGERSQVSGDINVEINGGAARGSNLFHSFSQFSIPTGGSAFFNNAAPIQNIFSRVTGGSISTIDGLIRANGTANLFLLNPNGILFGANARLDIGGSFLASTANNITFADDTLFSAKEPQATPLLTVSVPVGLQFGQNPGSITVQGSGYSLSSQEPLFTPTIRGSASGLQVPSGRMLALVGGDVNLDGGTITAEQGRIELGSVREGFVSLGFPTGAPTYQRVQRFGDVQLSKQALADASGGGVVQVQGDRISLVDGSLIFIQNQGNQQAGNLNINAAYLELSGASPDGASFIGGLRTETTGSRSGADITVSTQQFFAREGAGILPISYSSGPTGNVSVSASDQVYFVGSPQASATVQTLISTIGFDSGNAGNVTVSTRQLKLENGAYIGTQINSTNSDTRGGDITLNAESIEMFGRNNITVSSISTATNYAGNAGSITVNTSKLSIRDGTAITTYTLGSGNAGRVILNATESVDISGEVLLRSAPFASTVSSFSPVIPLPEFPIPSGNSGDVTLNTPLLRVIDKATIDVSNEGTGNAGTLRLNANSIVLDRGGSITAATASGEGGNLNLQVQDVLLLRGNSEITTSAGGTGNGGNINIDTASLVAVPTENNDIRADSVNARGGNITITANGLFGIQFRNQTTLQSDITATGVNSAFNGTVQLNVERTDFNREFVQLPTDLVDASGLIAQGCRDVRGSSFVVTGRGGLPPTPEQTVTDDPMWRDMRDLPIVSRVPIPPQTSLSSVMNNPVRTSPPALVEATGWVVDKQGKITLTATGSTNNSYKSLKQPMCNGV